MELHITPSMVLSSVLFGTISAYFAHKQGRNPYKWFFIGLLFGMVGCFALFFAPRAKRKPNEPERLPEAIPLPPRISPTNKPWYYLDDSHQQIGPMSHNALLCAFQEKKISLATYVWNEDMTNWKTLDEITAEKNANPHPV